MELTAYRGRLLVLLGLAPPTVRELHLIEFFDCCRLVDELEQDAARRNATRKRH